MDKTMNRGRSQIAKKGIVAGISILLLFTAGGVQAKNKKHVAPTNLNLVWPLPPEQPRIKFVQSIYGAADVEPLKKSNFLDRVAGIQIKNIKPGFAKPFGIAVDSHNRIYVSDTGQGIVFVLDRDNKQVSFIGSSPQVRLLLPLGITVDAKDRLWVADGVGQHVYSFDGNGTVLMVLGKQGEMDNPTSVAVDDSRHRLYVTDSHAHDILVYDTESGLLIGKFGSRGTDKGYFNFPTQVTLDRQGRIYVTDTMNFRVQIFDPNYKFLDTFGKQGNRFGQFLKPKGLAFDSYQNLYVVDSDFDNFQIFDPQHRLLMFVGSVGSDPGTFWLPAGICIDRNNYIYVSDQNNRRIQIFQLLNGEVPPATPAPVAASPSASREAGPNVVKSEKVSHQNGTKPVAKEISTP